MQSTIEPIPAKLQPNTLTTQVEKALKSNVYRELSDVRVSSDGGAITLNGELDSYFLKQVAQETVRRVAGVELVINDVFVF